MGFYVPEDDILHSHLRERLTTYNSVLYSSDVIYSMKRNVCSMDLHTYLDHLISQRRNQLVDVECSLWPVARQ
jgi:hypothetical protein